MTNKQYQLLHIPVNVDIAHEYLRLTAYKHMDIWQAVINLKAPTISPQN